MPINQKEPHRRSIRLQNYDYSQSGLYYVTISTQDQKCMLGEIMDGEMCLNQAGSIAQSIWNTLPERFPYVELDQSIVMPNHMHGIIALVGTSSMPQGDFYTAKIPERFRPFMHGVNAIHQGHITDTDSQAGAIHRTPALGEIIRTFKGAATYLIRTTGGPGFAWHRDYYEHIIRNDDDLNRIRQYIVNNPARWTEDRLYTRA